MTICSKGGGGGERKKSSLIRGKYSLWAGCYSVDCKGRVMTICSNGRKTKSTRWSEEHTLCGRVVIPLTDVLPGVSCYM